MFLPQSSCTVAWCVLGRKFRKLAKSVKGDKLDLQEIYTLACSTIRCDCEVCRPNWLVLFLATPPPPSYQFDGFKIRWGGMTRNADKHLDTLSLISEHLERCPPCQPPAPSRCQKWKIFDIPSLTMIFLVKACFKGDQVHPVFVLISAWKVDRKPAKWDSSQKRKAESR